MLKISNFAFMEHFDFFDKISISDFENKFSSKESCLKWLSEKKWAVGYVCRKCGNTNYCEGKTPYSRRCTKCKHIESATAHTLFHGCKISLPDAFKIAYEVCNSPQISTRKLSEKLNFRNMTCWGLKKKLIHCINQGGHKAAFGLTEFKNKHQ